MDLIEQKKWLSSLTFRALVIRWTTFKNMVHFHLLQYWEADLKNNFYDQIEIVFVEHAFVKAVDPWSRQGNPACSSQFRGQV